MKNFVGKGRRVLTFLLVVCMVMSLVPSLGINASADTQLAIHWYPGTGAQMELLYPYGWSIGYTLGYRTSDIASYPTVYQYLRYHNTCAAPPAARREGATFLGWFVNDDPNRPLTSTTLLSTSSHMYIYAKWAYNITYNANFPSSASNVQPSSQSRSLSSGTSLASYGSVFGSYPSASGRSYSFRGWYTSPSGGSQVSQVSIAAGNQTVYAQWNETVTNYDVLFIANFPSGAGSTPGNISRNLSSGSSMPAYGSVFGSSPSAPGKTYSFRGWYTSASGGSQVSTVTGNQTVYAQWNETVTNYDVLFNANFPSGAGSSPGNESRSLSNGSSMPAYGSVFGSSPSAAGKTYTFKGWYTSASGGSQVSTVTGNQTVYAQWNETINDYVITYEGNGATSGVPGTQPVTPGNTANLSMGTGMTRSGYVFVGWSATANPADIPADGTEPGGLLLPGAVYTPTGNVTLYAVWAVDANDDGEGDYLQKKKITLIVVGGDTVTDDILSVLDSSNQVVVKTNNTAQGAGTTGQTYKITQSASLDTTKYQLQSLHVNGADHTADFMDGVHDFVLEGDTTIYAVYHHDAQAGEYNVYANVISGVGTGTLQARRNNNGNVNSAPTGNFLSKISYDNAFSITKLTAEGLEADSQYMGVALLPASGYRVGSVLMNGEFISAGDEQWKTDGSNNVVITMPTDGDGNVPDRTSYYLIVSYVKDTGADYTVTFSSKTIDNGVEVTSIGTSNEVYLDGGGYSEAGHTIAYAEGTTVQFGARPGPGYELRNITLNGNEIAVGELLYHLVLPPLNDDHEIVATFYKKDAVEPSVLEPDNEILRGAWAGESTCDVTFWITSGGMAISQAELNTLTFEYSKALDWTSVSGNLHTIGTPVLTSDTKVEGGKTYSKVTVPVEVYNSGVGAISVKSAGNTLATAYVVTPGDVSADGKITASDLSAMLRVVNDSNIVPGKGLGNNFAFEMMDMNGDGTIRANDISTLIKIINGRDFIRNT